MKNFLLGVMATVLCIVAIGANYLDSGRTEYEYKEVRPQPGYAVVRVESLNGPGEEGWKLLLVHGPGSNRTGTAVFIREKR